MASPTRFQGPKGTRDFYPDEMALRRHIESAWRSAAIRSGFDEVDGPTFEHLGLYTVKSGPGIVSELFSFRRAGGDDDYALRPEFTPTLARMVAARAAALPVPVKWFAIPTFFRAERPQRGRLREFQQWNVDVLGLPGAEADTEVIATAALALETLGLRSNDVRVKVSHRGAVTQALGALGVSEERMSAALELLDKSQRLEAAQFDKLAQDAGLPLDALRRFVEASRLSVPLVGASAALAGRIGVPPAALSAMDELATHLADCGLSEWCEADLSIVRGLAYYTGTVFEIHEASGAERAIAGGGRYDKLVEMFGGPATPAVGLGMGDVVLGLVLQDRNLLPKDCSTLTPGPDVFILSVQGAESDRLAVQVAAQLRRAGKHVRRSYRATRNVGKLMADASKVRARTVLIIGEEISAGRVNLKDLQSGAQESLPLSEALARLSG